MNATTANAFLAVKEYIDAKIEYEFVMRDIGEDGYTYAPGDERLKRAQQELVRYADIFRDAAREEV